jgi:hypothetical protein
MLSNTKTRNQTQFLYMVASVLGIRLKSWMWEIYKSGSVRGVDVRYSRFK